MPAPASVLTFLQSGYARARQMVARGPLRLAVFTLLAVVTKWPALGKAGYFIDTTDAEHFSLFEDTARVTVLKFHQLPMWNPYYCGGIPALGTPSARFASPTFLLTLLFGSLRAEPLILVAMTVVGLEGTYRYARARGGGAMGAMLAAPLFALSGCFAHWPVFAWVNFYSFQLVPWALLGARATFRGSRRGVIVFAVAIALMIGFGGTYAAPLTAAAAAAEGVEAVMRRWHRPRALVRLVVAAGAAFVFLAAMSLFRLWPIAENLATSPRVLGGTEGTNLGRVWRDLFSDSAQKYQHGDYLVGIAMLPVFLLGALRRRALPFLAASLVWLWLAAGYAVKPSLFALLRSVPPYTMLRAPERILPLFILGFAVVSSLALRWLEVVARRDPRAVLLALGCVGIFGLNLVNLVKNDQETTRGRRMVAAPAVVDREFHQTRGNRWLGFSYAEMSRGVLACFDDYNVAQSPDLRGDLSREEYLRDPEAGTVTQTTWSPNRIELHVVLSRPARVYVNENWHPGWHASEGVVVSDNGLLSVDLPAGAHDVVLRFFPRSAIGGILTSLAALGVAIFVWRRTRQGDGFGSGPVLAREAGVFASPMLVAALSFVFLREPARPPTPLLTPDGEAIVSDSPPPDAAPLDARWVNEGITLTAARLKQSPSPSGKDTLLSVELDWRLDRKPPKGLAFFLHVEGSSSGFISLDYAFLSGTLLLDDAPLHKTLRDVIQNMVLPNPSEPKEIRVFAGVYYARRDGERLRDVETKTGTAERSGRVLIGSFTIP